jgi:hypothetical protein
MAGMGTTHQLARKSDDDAIVPFLVNLGSWQGEPSVSNVRQVASGGQHTMLLVN